MQQPHYYNGFLNVQLGNAAVSVEQSSCFRALETKSNTCSDSLQRTTAIQHLPGLRASTSTIATPRHPAPTPRAHRTIVRPSWPQTSLPYAVPLSRTVVQCSGPPEGGASIERPRKRMNKEWGGREGEHRGRLLIDSKQERECQQSNIPSGS